MSTNLELRSSVFSSTKSISKNLKMRVRRGRVLSF